ncbi:MAG: polysaccharide biosynthesis/export family protein [Deltaproteobacteria bacterium]|nr:polysaccharide biosynthesis/export family protein [Deltaproteobacteria bacterium]MBW2362959.1 polysaccharide biosynthesis/export family protein [Deltaproteobacteria bacterium]
MIDPSLQRRAGATSLSLFALFALACASTSPAPPPRDASFSEYRVGAPDQLMIVILPDPSIERVARVRPDGMISLDLIGDVPAAGRTVNEIASDIQARVSRFKRDPSVTVQLLDALSTGISVFGEVGQPSTFPLVKRTRVAEALAQVGGPRPFARTSKIRVIRSGGGETAVYLVNLNKIRAGDLSTNIQLVSGDIIYVEPTFIAKFGYAMNALLFPFQPLLGFGTSVAGSFVGN